MLAFFVALAGSLSYLTSLYIIKRTDKLGLIDIPNERSSHNKPTPRGGGVGIVLGTFIALFFCYLNGILIVNHKFLAVIVGSFTMSVIGFCSDRYNSSAFLRIILQTVVAGIMVLFIGYPSILRIGSFSLACGILGGIFSVVWLAGITNFYNFMDGIDGLAGAQALIAGIGIALCGIILKSYALVPLGLILSGATFGFLILNISEKKIFMGDVGSYFLGVYIASFGLINPKLFIPVAIILGVFILDPLVTLIRRIINGEPWQKAHRSHFYQRAVILGYTHLQVTAAITLVFMGLLITAGIYLAAKPLLQIIIIAAALLGIISLAFWVMGKENRKDRKQECAHSLENL